MLPMPLPSKFLRGLRQMGTIPTWTCQTRKIPRMVPKRMSSATEF